MATNSNSPLYSTPVIASSRCRWSEPIEGFNGEEFFILYRGKPMAIPLWNSSTSPSGGPPSYSYSSYIERRACRADSTSAPDFVRMSCRIIGSYTPTGDDEDKYWVAYCPTFRSSLSGFVGTRYRWEWHDTGCEILTYSGIPVRRRVARLQPNGPAGSRSDNDQSRATTPIYDYLIVTPEYLEPLKMDSDYNLLACLARRFYDPLVLTLPSDPTQRIVLLQERPNIGDSRARHPGV